MKYRSISAVISTSIFILSIAFLTFKGLNLGVDFTGGTIMEVSYPEGANIEEIRKTLSSIDLTDTQVQNFGTAKDVLITSQLRTAIVFNKKIKSANYSIDTYKKKIYIYGIAITQEERKEVINEAKQILDVEDIIASILLVEDLRIQKN